jgi:hypothetical protein
MSVESELRVLMEKVAATDYELAEQLSRATQFDDDASIDGISKGVLTTTDLLRIRGRLDALRDAVLVLAREVDALKATPDR